MQTISYLFYIGDRNLEQVTFQLERIQVENDLTGYMDRKRDIDK